MVRAMAMRSEPFSLSGPIPRRVADPPVSLADVRPLLRGLNREQRQAVTHGDGPLLVLAGPGTGKTEVITRRVAWLIATKRARPEQVLALTYTDAAAAEMQARVDVLVPYGQADTAIHTFHAFGDRLIREFALERGGNPDARLIGRSEQVLLLREHIFELGLERYRPLADPTRFLGALTELIARAKDEGIRPEEYRAFSEELRAGALAAAESAPDAASREACAALVEEAGGQAEIAAAFTRYQDLLVQEGLLDFSDQVSAAGSLLEERASLRALVQERYRYIVVDELQDANPAQVALLRLVAGEHANVTAVGDDDQAIYAFRGAAVETMVGLGEVYPGLRRIVLRRNYRSRAPILAAAQRLIAHNDPHRLHGRDGVEKALSAARGGTKPQPVRHLAFGTDTDEADGVAGLIADALAHGSRPNDICVLVRTNADARRFLASLKVRGIPWRFSGASGLFAREEVRAVLSLLRAIADPHSSVDLYGVATAHPYRLGGGGLTDIVDRARRLHRSLWDVLQELVDQPGLVRLDAAQRHGVERLVRDLREAIDESHMVAAWDATFRMMKRNGRVAALVVDAERGNDGPLRNVARFFEWLRRQGALLAQDRVAFLVPHLDALLESGGDDVEGTQDPDEAVSVLTIHRAKGLEFRSVYVVGLVDGRFPHPDRRGRLPLPEPLRRRRGGDEQPWAEERRLFYVALTRARDELVLTSSERSDSGRRRRPSPFVAESLDRPAASVDLPGENRGAIDLLTRLDREHSAPAAAAIPAASTGTASPQQHLTLSYTQVDDYTACPLKYRLRHVVRVPTPPHHALVVGNALHQAAAAYHASGMRGHSMDEEQLLDVYRTHWSSEGFLSRAHEDARFAAGEAALRRFVADETREGALPPVAVERPFNVRLGADTVRGRYDRIDQTPAGVVITDYKSSDVRDPKTAVQRARDSLQLQVYALAYQAETGHLPTAMQLRFLETGVVGRVSPSARQLDKARETVERAADGIRNERFDPTPGYLACTYCPFRDICPQSAA
jgi:DNA helicase II / ATP-dependent DNA helicase PcrA